MENSTFRRLAAGLLTTFVAAAGWLRGQTVLVNEVRADLGGRWIELHNRGATPVDLSTWSLHYCSRTPGMAQTYWWPFPSGTVLAANGYLRVNWYQVGVNVPGASELWTGTSPYGFLFGLGGEQLSGTRGALALFRSQQNLQMNTAAMIADWVSWGEHDFPREALAVSEGLWTSGRHCPALPAGSSMARDAASIGVAQYTDLQWFFDSTPTPLLPNVTGAVVAAHGQPCTFPGHHLLGAPTLSAISLPLLGNSGFALTVGNTTGVLGEYVLIAFSAEAAAPGAPPVLPPISGVTCQQAIDIAQLITTRVMPSTILATPSPLPLVGLDPSLLGSELHAQALVLDLMPNAWPPFQGTSNGLRLVVGQ